MTNRSVVGRSSPVDGSAISPPLLPSRSYSVWLYASAFLSVFLLTHLWFVHSFHLRWSSIEKNVELKNRNLDVHALLVFCLRS